MLCYMKNIYNNFKQIFSSLNIILNKSQICWVFFIKYFKCFFCVFPAFWIVIYIYFSLSISSSSSRHAVQLLLSCACPGGWIDWYAWECGSGAKVSLHWEIRGKWFLILLDTLDGKSGASWECGHRGSAAEFGL